MTAVLGVVAVVLAAVVIGLAVWLRQALAVAADLTAATRSRDEAVARAEWSERTVAELRAALDAVPQGVMVVDGQGEVVARNRVAEQVAGARHGAALVGGEVDELTARAIAGQGGSRTIELFGPPAQVVEVVARPLPDGALVVIDDVTEAHRLEAMRRDFVANLSHELKTPVGAIGLLAETLLAEPDPDVAHRLTERVVNESFRVSRTIDDLLELSRIEAGPRDAREVVPVHLVLEEAADRIRPAAERRDIGIRIEGVSPRLSAWGDRRQLVSAVANLLDNAVKYSSPGSTVEVRAASDGTTVEVEVEDHGLGIPARDLERIFERFYRVDRARSRDTGGTGLGLAIVRHVVANHEGEVTVTSTEGQGSTFTVHVPAGPGPVAVEEHTPRRSA